MNQADLRQLAAALQNLAAHYPRTDIQPPTIKAYISSLSDLPLPAVTTAIERCAKTSTFFPSVAEIRKEIGAAVHNPEQIAETAWIEVIAQVRRCGARKTQTFTNGKFYESPDPTFSSDLIRRVVESIGWQNLCLEPQAKMRTEFIFGYRRLFDAAVSTIQRGDIDTTTSLPANVSAIKEIAS